MTNIGRTMLTLGMLIIGVAICGTTFAADDIVKVAPNHCKVVLENENVRVIEYTAKAGDKVGMHWHPAHVIYIISGGGKTKFTAEDGKSDEREMKVGTSVWVDEVTHATEHMGKEETRVLIVEMKK